MNQIAERSERLPMDSVGITTSGTGSKIAPQNLAEVVKFAEVMSRADIAIPKHLRGNAGACMAVALQALDWQMNPFAVASKSYSVNGTIAYEAQLIIAVINTRSGIEGRITYEFEGEGPDKVCIARGKLEGIVLEVKSPKFKDITPKNSPLWKSDPDQQHCYYTGRAWGRRFTPEVILGVYDRDEAEQFGPEHARDVTPKPSVMERLRAKAESAAEEPAGEREGFQASTLDGEPYDILTGEILDNEDSDARSPAAASDVSEVAPSSASLDEPAGDAPHSAPAGSVDSTFEPIPEKELPIIRKFAKIAFDTAKTDGINQDTLTKVMNRLINTDLSAVQSKSGKDAVNGIRRSAKAINDGVTSFDSAVSFHSDGLSCEPADLMVEAADHG